MVKGVAIRFEGYDESIPKLLKLIKFDEELKKHEKIVLKPDLIDGGRYGTPVEFVEEVLKYISENKNPGTEIFIAEGCDGYNTLDVFEKQGYRGLSEKYGVGLVDLNKSETEEIRNEEFLHFEEINYPKILLDGFVLSLPILKTEGRFRFSGGLSNMLGAFPASHYKGFFSKKKNKLDKVPLRQQVHDILKCKMPDFVIADASEQGNILAGQPIEIDKRGASLFDLGSEDLEYIDLIEESFNNLLSTDKDEKER